MERTIVSLCIHVSITNTLLSLGVLLCPDAILFWDYFLGRFKLPLQEFNYEN